MCTPIQRKGIFQSSSRGMRGVYQHCKEKHLHRYLAEFDHRYNHRVALRYSDLTARWLRSVVSKASG
jgi:hypothetical protein